MSRASHSQLLGFVKLLVGALLLLATVACGDAAASMGRKSYRNRRVQLPRDSTSFTCQGSKEEEGDGDKDDLFFHVLRRDFRSHTIECVANGPRSSECLVFDSEEQCNRANQVWDAAVNQGWIVSCKDIASPTTTGESDESELKSPPWCRWRRKFRVPLEGAPSTPWPPSLQREQVLTPGDGSESSGGPSLLQHSQTESSQPSDALPSEEASRQQTGQTSIVQDSVDDFADHARGRHAGPKPTSVQTDKLLRTKRQDRRTAYKAVKPSLRQHQKTHQPGVDTAASGAPSPTSRPNFTSVFREGNRFFLVDAELPVSEQTSTPTGSPEWIGRLVPSAAVAQELGLWPAIANATSIPSGQKVRFSTPLSANVEPQEQVLFEHPIALAENVQLQFSSRYGLAAGTKATLAFQLWIWDFLFTETATPERLVFLTNPTTVQGVSIGLVLGFGQHPQRPYLALYAHGSTLFGSYVPYALEARTWYQFHVAVVHELVQLYLDGVLLLQLSMLPHVHKKSTLDGPRCPLTIEGGVTHYGSGDTFFGYAKQFYGIPALVAAASVTEGWAPRLDIDPGFTNSRPPSPSGSTLWPSLTPANLAPPPLPTAFIAAAEVMSLQLADLQQAKDAQRKVGTKEGGATAKSSTPNVDSDISVEAHSENEQLTGPAVRTTMFDIGVWLAAGNGVASVAGMFPRALQTLAQIVDLARSTQTQVEVSDNEKQVALSKLSAREVVFLALQRDGTPPLPNIRTNDRTGVIEDTTGKTANDTGKRPKGVESEPGSSTMCLHSHQGYWSFQWCTRSSIHQYHLAKIGQMDTAETVTVLGFFDRNSSAVLATETVSLGVDSGTGEGKPSSNLGQEGHATDKLAGEGLTNGRPNDNTLREEVYVEKFVEGDFCQSASVNRSATVRFECCLRGRSTRHDEETTGGAFSKMRIQSVSEPSTCTYKVRVCVPDLCELERARHAVANVTTESSPNPQTLNDHLKESSVPSSPPDVASKDELLSLNAPTFCVGSHLVPDTLDVHESLRRVLSFAHGEMVAASGSSQYQFQELNERLHICKQSSKSRSGLLATDHEDTDPSDTVTASVLQKGPSKFWLSHTAFLLGIVSGGSHISQLQNNGASRGQSHSSYLLAFQQATSSRGRSDVAKATEPPGLSSQRNTNHTMQPILVTDSVLDSPQHGQEAALIGLAYHYAHTLNNAVQGGTNSPMTVDASGLFASGSSTGSPLLLPTHLHLAFKNATVTNLSSAIDHEVRLNMGDLYGRVWTESVWEAETRSRSSEAIISALRPRDASFDSWDLRRIFQTDLRSGRPDEAVSCGGHTAPSCAECPNGHGASHCNGDCRWIETQDKDSTHRCVPVAAAPLVDPPLPEPTLPPRPAISHARPSTGFFHSSSLCMAHRGPAIYNISHTAHGEGSTVHREDSSLGSGVGQKGSIGSNMNEDVAQSTFQSMGKNDSISLISGSCQAVVGYLRAATDRLLENRAEFMPHFPDAIVLADEPDLQSFLAGEDAASAQYTLKLANDDGDANAQVWVAAHYYWGNQGFPQDRALAYDYYARAAAQGLPEAHYNLGVLETEGFEGHAPNGTAADEHFEAASNNGYAAATNGLGAKFMQPGKNRNLTKAFELFRSAAETGSLDGFFNLARLLRSGGYNLTVFRESHRLYGFSPTQSPTVAENLSLDDDDRASGNGTGDCLLQPTVDYSRPAGSNVPLAVHYFATAAERGHFHATQLLGSEFARSDGWLARYFKAQQREKFEIAVSKTLIPPSAVIDPLSLGGSKESLGGMGDQTSRVLERNVTAEGGHTSDNATLFDWQSNGDFVILNLVRPNEDHVPADQRKGVGFNIINQDGFVVAEDVWEDGVAYAQGLRSGSVISHVDGHAVATVTGYMALAYGRGNFQIRATFPSKHAEVVPPGKCSHSIVRRHNNPLLPVNHHAVNWPTMVSVDRGGNPNQQVVLPLRPSCEVAAYYLALAAQCGHGGQVMKKAINRAVKSDLSRTFALSPRQSMLSSVARAVTAEYVPPLHTSSAERRAHEMYEAASVLGYPNAHLNSGWFFARLHARAKLERRFQSMAGMPADRELIKPQQQQKNSEQSKEDGASSRQRLERIGYYGLFAPVTQSPLDNDLSSALAVSLQSMPIGQSGVDGGSSAFDSLHLAALLRFLQAAEGGNIDAMNWLGYAFAGGATALNEVPGIRSSPSFAAIETVAAMHDRAAKGLLSLTNMPSQGMPKQEDGIMSKEEVHGVIRFENGLDGTRSQYAIENVPLGSWWRSLEEFLVNVAGAPNAAVYALRISVASAASLSNLLAWTIVHHISSLIFGSPRSVMEGDDGRSPGKVEARHDDSSANSADNSRPTAHSANVGVGDDLPFLPPSSFAAARMFFNAAARGSEEGRFNLARMLLEGKGNVGTHGLDEGQGSKTNLQNNKDFAQALLQDVASRHDVPAQLFLWWCDLKVPSLTGLASTLQDMDWEDAAIALLAPMVLCVLVCVFFGPTAYVVVTVLLALFLIWTVSA